MKQNPPVDGEIALSSSSAIASEDNIVGFDKFSSKRNEHGRRGDSPEHRGEVPVSSTPNTDQIVDAAASQAQVLSLADIREAGSKQRLFDAAPSSPRPYRPCVEEKAATDVQTSWGDEEVIPIDWQEAVTMLNDMRLWLYEYEDDDEIIEAARDGITALDMFIDCIDESLTKAERVDSLFWRMAHMANGIADVECLPKELRWKVYIVANLDRPDLSDFAKAFAEFASAEDAMPCGLKDSSDEEESP